MKWGRDSTATRGTPQENRSLLDDGDDDLASLDPLASGAHRGRCVNGPVPSRTMTKWLAF